MSETTPSTRTSLVVDDRTPISIDVEESLDDVYGALADERRRHILVTLTGRTEPIGVESLARLVAEQEGEATGEAVRKVRTSMRHCHLPKLAATELVAYDTDAGTVERTFDSCESTGT